jgi:ribosomal-protein-alanine N-acetyltransferase
MTFDDIDEAVRIEREVFPVPWTERMFRDELKNERAYYLIARNGGEAVGYCGMWHVVNEGHITNLAVLPEFRRRGIGRDMVNKMIEYAVNKEMVGLTLEVRMGNAAALGLYAKMGFKPEGIRKNYYAETKEDAVIMWLYFGR